MMLKKSLLACAIMLAFTLPAAAKIQGCYMVRYSKAQMARHPQMSVTVLSFQIDAPGGGEESEDIFELLVKDSEHIRLNGFRCTKLDAGEKLVCKVEERMGDRNDRGAFTVEETKDGVIFAAQTDIKLVGEGGAGNHVLKLAPNEADRRFSLKKMKDPICPYIFGMVPK
jgi:hypothetical protein